MLISGLHDGRIIRTAPDSQTLDVLANTGGRPLGLAPKPIKRNGFVLGLDTEGKVIANLQDRSAGNYSPITTAREYGDWLYLGSLKNTSMARLPLAAALAP